jgi:hypothetical protein
MTITKATITTAARRVIAPAAIGLTLLDAPATAALSSAATANAASPSAVEIRTGVDDLWWVNQISPKVDVPHVDTTVHQSR